MKNIIYGVIAIVLIVAIIWSTKVFVKSFTSESAQVLVVATSDTTPLPLLLSDEGALSLEDLDGLIIKIPYGGSVCGCLHLTVAQAKELAERLGLPVRQRNGKFIVVVQPGDEFRLTYYPEDFSLLWDKLVRL